MPSLSLNYYHQNIIGTRAVVLLMAEIVRPTLIQQISYSLQVQSLTGFLAFCPPSVDRMKFTLAIYINTFSASWSKLLLFEGFSAILV